VHQKNIKRTIRKQLKTVSRLETSCRASEEYQAYHTKTTKNSFQTGSVFLPGSGGSWPFFNTFWKFYFIFMVIQAVLSLGFSRDFLQTYREHISWRGLLYSCSQR